MSFILPQAPQTYDPSNERQNRGLTERGISDLQQNLQLLRVTQGSLALGETTLTLVNGANNNLATGYTTYARVTGPSGAFSITGLEGGEIGRVRILTNTTSQVMTIAHQSASSSAMNRIITDAAADITVGLNGVVTLVYDATQTRWLVWDRTGGVTNGDKGDITVSGSGNTWTIDNDAVTDAKLRDSGALSVIGRSANSPGDPADITATSDNWILRRSGSTVAFGTIVGAGMANNTVTYAKMQNVSATDRLLGRSTAGAGDVEEIICTAVGRALLDDATAGDQLTTLGISAFAQTFLDDTSAALVLGTLGLRLTIGTIADDNVVTIAFGTNTAGILLIGATAAGTMRPAVFFMRAFTTTNQFGLIAEYTGGGAPATGLYTTALTGTTGTDTQINLGVDTSNNIYIENRRGFSAALTGYLMRF